MLKRFTLLATIALIAPCVQAEIALRVAASNPSRLAATTVEVKRLLPEGITREDVLDADGLDVVYDADAKRYGVQKRVDLQPEERRVFTIQLRDIWVFDEAMLRDIDTRAEEVMEILNHTRADREGSLLRARVARNIAAILDLQSRTGISDVSVPEHISAYDRSAVRFEVVQEDMRMLEATLSLIGDEILIDKGKDTAPLDIAMLWKVILGVISFVAVVTVVCFIVWSGQVKKIREAEREAGLVVD